MTTRRCHTRDHPAYVDAVAAEVAQMSGVIRQADLAARVPSCPDWSLADLVEHTGSVHRWVSAMVQVLTPKRIPSAELDLELPAEPAGMPAWFDVGGALVLEALRATDPDAAMWAWGDDQHARFWARRMLHETAVHRVDAELAVGALPVIDPVVAVDGIDEALDNLPRAVRFAPNVAGLVGTGEALAFRALDAGVDWRVVLGPEGFTWSHDLDHTDAGVGADAADLYLFMWGRIAADDDRLTVRGDRDLLDRWVSGAAI